MSEPRGVVRSNSPGSKDALRAEVSRLQEENARLKKESARLRRIRAAAVELMLVAEQHIPDRTRELTVEPALTNLRAAVEKR